MAQQTAMILLDEPISHQDPRHQGLLLQALQERARCTCVAALHDINAAARFGTHALLLHGDGRWESGPAEETLSPERLSPLFGTAITRWVVGSHRVFVSTGGTAA
jgi:iron complex transport system ATP-binding protein